MSSEEQKLAAAKSVVRLVRDGQVIGLGTGTTIRCAIVELAKIIQKEGLEIKCVPTSLDTQLLAIENKIPLATLDEYPDLDLAIDGADEVDAGLNLIKGGGGAHTREKIVASCAKKFVVAVDESKLKKVLSAPVPIEVLPFAKRIAEARLRKLGGRPMLRLGARKIGPVITDNGNFILDVDFGEIKNPKKLEEEINEVVGVVENGIFPNMCSEVHAGTRNGVKILRG